MGNVKLQIPVRMQKNHFAVIIAEHFKRFNFRVKTTFELCGKMIDIDTFNSRFVGSSGENKLTVWRHTNGSCYARHLEVLDELDSFRQINIFVQS